MTIRIKKPARFRRTRDDRRLVVKATAGLRRRAHAAEAARQELRIRLAAFLANFDLYYKTDPERVATQLGHLRRHVFAKGA